MLSDDEVTRVYFLYRDLCDHASQADQLRKELKSLGLPYDEMYAAYETTHATISQMRRECPELEAMLEQERQRRFLR